MILRGIRKVGTSVRVDDLCQTGHKQVHATADAIERIVGRRNIPDPAWFLLLAIISFLMPFFVTNISMILYVSMGFAIIVCVITTHSVRLDNKKDVSEIMGLVAQSSRARELLDASRQASPYLRSVFEDVPSLGVVQA